MRRIALLSYTLYLVHSGLIIMVAYPDGTHPLLANVAALVASFVYALAMHRWVKEPMAR